MLILGFILWTWPLIFVLLYVLINRLVTPHKSVCILVLGDIGRSPRMQYHSLSFAKEGYEVDIVGYKDVPRLLAYLFKVLWQSITLCLKLLLLPKFGVLILQNPPSIPTIAVAVCVCTLRGSFLLIDWHNYGYTILGLTLGVKHPLVKFSNWYEHFMGRISGANLCVTNAMKEDLSSNWKISAETLYDRPADVFQTASIEERHQLFTKLSSKYPVFKSVDQKENSTAFTQQRTDGQIEYKQSRPALLVSSTSWTEDEDFGILLQALKGYEDVAESRNVPDIVCVITGKGPQKEFYRQKIESYSWSHVQFCLPWLEAEDYPVLLGSADLGVCLHKSSSGLDLPMKVVDMFGCGLPVCAVFYSCLSELVKNGRNGLVFKDSEELCTQIQDLFCKFPNDQTTLLQMRENLKSFQANRWHANWKSTVLPLIENNLKFKQS